MTTANPKVVQSLLQTARDEDVEVACNAIQSLASLGDRSIVPCLMQERDAVRAELNAGDRLVDASEARREMALTMGIISLLTPAECEALVERADEFEKYMVRRKFTVSSVEEFWGPLRS
jgi:hypothetical protein